VDHLNHKFILGEILPQRDIEIEVIAGQEIVIPNFRESIDGMPSLITRRKESSKENKGQQTMSHACHRLSEHVMISHVFQSDYCFLRSAQQMQGHPKCDSIDYIRVVSMKSQSVWAYCRGFIEFLRLLFVNQPTFDHPPAHKTLQCSETQQ